jgi:phosphohistidine phosphatase
MATRTLLLLRHASAEDARPGARDSERRLTDHGREQAAALGRWLARLPEIDAAICSTAVRARETLDRCAPSAPADYVGALYNAGADTIIELVRALPDQVQCVLVVGHAPGIPGAAFELADPQHSDPAALAALDRYPAATLAVLTFHGTWPDLVTARLSAVRYPNT